MNDNLIEIDQLEKRLGYFYSYFDYKSKNPTDYFRSYHDYRNEEPKSSDPSSFSRKYILIEDKFVWDTRLHVTMSQKDNQRNLSITVEPVYNALIEQVRKIVYICFFDHASKYANVFHTALVNTHECSNFYDQKNNFIFILKIFLQKTNHSGI